MHQPGPVHPREARHSALQAPRMRSRLSADGRLGAWQAMNAAATIPHCIAQLEASGTLDNLRRVVGESGAEFRGFHFADSDVYKTLEAIGWQAGIGDVSAHEPFVADTIALLRRVQQGDGYLNSFFQGGKPDEIFADLRWGHELYCLGHLVQAAVAWQRTTARTELLDLALPFVELVWNRFGPSLEPGAADAGGVPGYCGHPELETALVELYRVTGDARHLELARLMIDRRGTGLLGEDRLGRRYFQDHERLVDAEEATGHAVRQLYLAAGAADVAAETGDAGYSAALERLWRSVHEEKLYVTGGLGSRHRDESFGDPYELPPDRAYSETCAAIANLQWNWRMLLRTGEARFADEIERGLYNAIAVSTAADGCAFFYSNPLQLRAGHDPHDEDAPSERLRWYSCACCPPNLARLLASIDTMLATSSSRGIQLHHYAAGEVRVLDQSGIEHVATIDTAYPWDGAIAIDFALPLRVELALRIPAWARGFTLEVDGVIVEAAAPDGYARLAPGIRSIRLGLEMPIERVEAHQRIDAVRGCVAVRRGPVLYCLEQADLPEGVDVQDVALARNPGARVVGGHALGVPAIEAEAVVRPSAGRPLYARASEAAASADPITVTMVPYASWGNRATGPMRVWIPMDVSR